MKFFTEFRISFALETVFVYVQKICRSFFFNFIFLRKGVLIMDDTLQRGWPGYFPPQRMVNMVLPGIRGFVLLIMALTGRASGKSLRTVNHQSGEGRPP